MHLIEQSGLFTLFALTRGRDAEIQAGEGPGGSFCCSHLRGRGLSGHQGQRPLAGSFTLFLPLYPSTSNRVIPPPSLQSDHLYTAICCYLSVCCSPVSQPLFTTPPISAVTLGYITTPEDLALEISGKKGHATFVSLALGFLAQHSQA